MIIRDLTLRSAQSFGSFHLIRLLFDEYMLYLVELRLAKAANRPALAVMAMVGLKPGVDMFQPSLDWQPTLNGTLGLPNMHGNSFNLLRIFPQIKYWMRSRWWKSIQRRQRLSICSTWGRRTWTILLEVGKPGQNMFQQNKTSRSRSSSVPKHQVIYCNLN